MRKQLLGLLVPLLAFVVITIAAAADTTGKGVAAGARLQRLEVAHSQDGLRIEFKAKGALAPKVSTLESPARIVVDFPNTVMATAQSHIVVDRDGVKDVRIGMDGQVPPSTHVVIDLADGDRAAGRQHELVAGPEGSFVLKIHEAVLAHRQPAPAVKSPGASQAPQLALASAPVTPATTSATPTFPPKPAEPVAKAKEAASRFADKTAAELVATSTNAALGQAGSNKPAIQPAVNLAAEQKAQLEQKPALNGAKYRSDERRVG